MPSVPLFQFLSLFLIINNKNNSMFWECFIFSEPDHIGWISNPLGNPAGRGCLDAVTLPDSIEVPGALGSPSSRDAQIGGGSRMAWTNRMGRVWKGSSPPTLGCFPHIKWGIDSFLNLAIRSSWSEPQTAPGLVFFWLYRTSPSLAAKNVISLISVLTIWWCPSVELSFILLWALAMTSAFSWENSVSCCPASFCTLRPNLPVTPGVSWLPTFAVQFPMMKRTSFLGVSYRRPYRSSKNCSAFSASLVGA